MASSEVKICNMALGRVGISIFISSLSETSTQATVCNQFYESSRDFVLADFPWNFASNRAALADIGTPPTNWLYRYALPADCLTVSHLVVAGSREPLPKDRHPFELGEEDNVRVLYTDVEAAELVYTRRITNPNLFSAQFESALAWHLASEIALPLSAAAGLGDRAFKMYDHIVSKAQAGNLREHQGGEEPECEFLTGRN